MYGRFLSKEGIEHYFEANEIDTRKLTIPVLNKLISLYSRIRDIALYLNQSLEVEHYEDLIEDVKSIKKYLHAPSKIRKTAFTKRAPRV